MAQTNGNGRYIATARFLHWLTVIAVFATIPAGAIMVQQGISRSVQDALYLFHKNIGVLILLVVLLRLGVRAVRPPPPLPRDIPPLQRRIAGLSHGMLYLLLIVMAVSGYVRVKAGGFPLEGLDALGVPSLVPRSDGVEQAAKWTHATARYALIGFIALHVGAAFFHLLVRRDGVFRRMWPPLGR